MRRIIALYVISAMGACALFPDLGGLSGDASVDVDIANDASADVKTTDASVDAKLDAPSDANTRVKNITFENGLIIDPILGVQSYNPPALLIDAGALADKFSVGTVQPTADAADQVSSYTQDFLPLEAAYVSVMFRIDAVPSALARFVKFGNSQTTLQAFVVPATVTTYIVRFRLRDSTTATTDKTLGDTAELPYGQTVRLGFVMIQQSAADAGNATVEGYVALGTTAFGTPFLQTNQETFLGPTDEVVVGASTATFISGTFDNIRIDSAKMPAP